MITTSMIEAAFQRAARSGVQVRFEVGDAEDMPYPDANFDVVSSTFGVMFAPDHEAVARELARVCRSGGRIGLATWRPDGGVGDLFKVMAPFQAPTPEGVGNPFNWGREEHAERLLGEAFGLTFEDGDAPQTGASGEELWELFSTAYGPTKALASSLEPERREQLHRAWVDYYERQRVNGGIRQPRQYLLILGDAPLTDRPYGSRSGHVAFDATVVKAATQLGVHVLAQGEGIAPNQVYEAVLAGHPVVTWVTYQWVIQRRQDYVAFDGRVIPYAGPGEHAVTIVGVDPTRVLVNNPWSGPEWVSKALFERIYLTYNQMAVVLA